MSEEDIMYARITQLTDIYEIDGGQFVDDCSTCSSSASDVEEVDEDD